jgi:hypothetical protein
MRTAMAISASLGLTVALTSAAFAQGGMPSRRRRKLPSGGNHRLGRTGSSRADPGTPTSSRCRLSRVTHRGGGHDAGRPIPYAVSV